MRQKNETKRHKTLKIKDLCLLRHVSLRQGVPIETLFPDPKGSSVTSKANPTGRLARLRAWTVLCDKSYRRTNKLARFLRSPHNQQLLISCF
jgi:hypothetical protein